jgi:hypothetical protein
MKDRKMSVDTVCEVVYPCALHRLQVPFVSCNVSCDTWHFFSKSMVDRYRVLSLYVACCVCIG